MSRSPRYYTGVHTVVGCNAPGGTICLVCRDRTDLRLSEFAPDPQLARVHAGRSQKEAAQLARMVQARDEDRRLREYLGAIEEEKVRRWRAGDPVTPARPVLVPPDR